MGIAAGEVLASRYRADALLGRGGMGEVWRCFDLVEKRDVAIKTVLAEHLAKPHAWRLFQAEVIAVARLGHPGIVEVYDLLQRSDKSSLLVMEYRPGKALDEALLSAPSWSLVRTLFVQLLEALAHAHARSVLHLDIKPANVLVERRGDGLRATLVDFGIARIKHPGRGAEKWFDNAVVVGTLEYMAPEQCRGELQKLGPWTDLYALGMMAYELTCGELPHGAEDPIEAIRQRLSQPPPLLQPRLNSVPPGFEELCARLLAIEPRDRPACAADVLAELEHIDPESARRSDLRGLSSRPPSRSEPPADASSAPTLAAAHTEAPTLLARERFDEVFAELDREAAEAQPTTGALSVAPPSSHRKQADEAEQAFTAEALPPTPGAYGLFGLRELPVLGRVEERRALWAAIRATALEGRVGAVLLVGPAGTGKSRLARDAVERSLELGLATVIHTHWSQDGSADEGLRGMIENALESRGYRDADFEARLSFWLGRLAGDDEAFARELRVLLRPEQDAAPDAALPVRAAVELIARTATLRPVLLWLDDVQWSRGEATALIQALAARPLRPPVCVLATVREEEMAQGHEHDALLAALGELCPASQVARVPLRPLNIGAARQLVRGLLDLERELRELIAQRSEGNPLFATQLVRQLVVERAIVKRGRRYGLARHVDLASILPADIGAVWARRVALSGASDSDLRALAMVRERVSIEVADALARSMDNGLAASIARALEAGLLLREGERYAWTHGLLRQYLLSSASAEEAPQLHAWSAQALSLLVGREDVQEERALHLCNAGKHREASEAMLDAALWCWRRAERDARQRRVETLRAWAAASGFVDLEARALAELGHLHAERGDFETASEAIDRASERAPMLDPRAASWIQLRVAQVRTLQGDAQRGADACRRAVELARRAGDGEVEATSLIQLGLDAYRRGCLDDARPLFDEAIGVARSAGNRAAEALALLQRSLLEPAAPQERLLRTAIQMAHAAGALRIELMARQLWVDALWQVGRRHDARVEAERVSAESARRSLRQTVSIVELQAACWAAEEDDWPRLRDHRNAAGQWGAEAGAVPERAVASALDLLLALHDGDGAGAERALQKLHGEASGYEESTFRDLLAKAATMAPPHLAARVEQLRQG